MTTFNISAPPLPTLYQHYASPTIHSGLSANQSYFTLNDQNITLYSGAMHYFRIPRQYWRDRLRKMRAAGLNTVETYIPWNLHEPGNNIYDFGQGKSDMEDFLHVKEFLEIAKEEDLFAIVRPGPYICSEWDFGGLPSWLLRHKNIQVRTSDSTFMFYVTRYFSMLLSILTLLQFTKGGPIIAFQVENEYGSVEDSLFQPDKNYLNQLSKLFHQHGIVELLVTSDSPTMHESVGTIPTLFLQTANFWGEPKTEFNKLKKLQTNKPSMAMEFWVGWFDHWSENHNTRHPDDFTETLEQILSYPASVNMYMFHGGTNWGFLNGANLGNGGNDNAAYQPDTTSYDYDALLSESGDYTEKYFITKRLLKKYNPIRTKLPTIPLLIPRVSYQPIQIEKEMLLDDILSNIFQHFNKKSPISMEQLPINNNSGQSYGYVVYRKNHINISANSILQITGHVCDTVVVLVNGLLMSKPLLESNDLNGFGFWREANSTLMLGPQDLKNTTIDLVVENWGRVNYGALRQFNQFKGLWQGDILLNGEVLYNWDIYPLEFKSSWIRNLKSWRVPSRRWATGPSLHKTTLIVENPRDTYIGMEKWTKGIVIVNDFVLGRYSRIGPQQRLYLPAPFLKIGNNSIIVFEHYLAETEIQFFENQSYYTV